MTRTETTNTVDTGSTFTRHVWCNRSTDCRCGQQLDMGVSAHCPRCGRSLVRG